MEQSALKTEAEGIIRELGLLAMLAQYGEASVVGSVALDLIVKLDIDVHVVVPQGSTPLVAEEVCRILAGRVPNVHLKDYSQKGGLKVGVDPYPGNSGDWSIDIWITDRPETSGRIPTELLSQRLTIEHREAIMRIKSHYHALGLCENGMSTRIYEAVVDGGMRTAEDFEALGGAQTKRAGRLDGTRPH